MTNKTMYVGSLVGCLVLGYLAAVVDQAGVRAQETPPAYVIAKVTIADDDAYGAYRVRFLPILEEHDGEILSVDRTPEILEGEWPATTTVLLKFPSERHALGWYSSEEYQEIVAIRQAVSRADLIAIEGRL